MPPSDRGRGGTRKVQGTFAAARFTGLGRYDAAALGVLMNTRGLVELIVLNIGLDIGAITPRLFTMLVIMALVTTFMTGPVLNRLTRRLGPDAGYTERNELASSE